MLGYEGYIYNLERRTEAKMIFRCQNRDCKGRCHTDPSMDAILSGPTEHCHAPNLDRLPVIELKNKIKSRAADSEESSSTILHTLIRSFPLDAAGQLPKTETLLRTIRRQRQADPTDPDQLMPDRLKLTDRGESFVLHEDESLIVFTTASNLSILKSCKHWFADGTFKVCPDEFYQMFTLHGLFKSQVVPLVYGLLIGKKTEDYNDFFRIIMDRDDFNPETILTDFEAATLKSVKGLFPGILHKGCLFHFGQCIWRKVQDFGLKKKYQEDTSFYLSVRKLVALAFVPLSDIYKAYDLITDEFDDDAEKLLDYFEATWIGAPKKRGTGRKKPAFPLELWNVYDRVCADLPRSNNSIEGWHHAFADRVAIAHPTITKLADKIRREQSKFEVEIAQIRQGHEPKPKKVLYRKLDERFKRLVDDYANVGLGEYLKGIASNITL